VPILTLTTDFGSKDGFVGTLKGVIWSICPEAQIADITHDIAPQNIREGALALWRAYPFFPAGTVHVAVVDPGVGTSRRPIAARLGKHFFVGPDNGLFTPMYDDAAREGWGAEIVQLTNSRYFLPKVSQTFHGRDIFSPVAAHLARGVPLQDMGPAVTDPVRLPLSRPEPTSTGWTAHITVIDVFGNLATDLPAREILGKGQPRFRLCGREVRGMVDSYGQRNAGDLVALVDSEDYVEIAVVNGSAAQVLGARVGDPVDVVFP
jgi:S-adenosylmethionine hydrolase